MRPRHAVPLTPSKATRLSHPSCGAEHLFRTTNPLPAAHYCPKSFSCNTYGSPRKCCKQKTYGLTKPFRCSTYKKHGGQGVPTSKCSNVQRLLGLSMLPFSPQQVLNVVHLFPQQMELPRQALNFRFGTAI